MALSGPRLPPARGAATELVVLLHGYGADGNDLIGLAPHLQRALPGAGFVAPNAPELCPGAGYQWFALARLDPHEMHKGVLGATPVLEAFLTAELKRLDLAPARLALIGFSQGTMMALQVGLTASLKPAAIVGLSGMLTAPPPHPSHPTPILLAHGDSDAVIPPDAMFLAASTLGAGGYAVQWHLSPGLAHGIDETGLALAGRFLAQAFAGKLAIHGEICCPAVANSSHRIA